MFKPPHLKSPLKSPLKTSPFYSKFSFIAAMGCIFCFLLILLITFTTSTVGDFGNYYYGSLFLREGLFNVNLYEPILFNKLVGQHNTAQFFLNYTPVPPFSALLYVPFTYLSFVKAKYAWNLFCLVFFVVSFYRFAKYYQIKPWILLFVMVGMYIPLKTNFFLGQSYLLLLAWLIEGLLAYEKGKRTQAMLWWSLAILLKIFPAVIIFFLLRHKDIRSILVLGLILAAEIFISFNWIEPQIWRHYLLDIVPRLMAGEINNPYANNYQSMDVLLRKLFLFDPILNTQTWRHLPIAYFTWLIVFKTAVLVLLMNIKMEGENRIFRLFAFTMLAGLLLSGYGSLYGYLQLVFVFVLIISLKPSLKSIVWVLIGSLVISFPLARNNDWPLVLEFIKLFFLLVLFAFLIRPFIKWKLSSIWLILPLICFWILSGYRSFTKISTPGLPADINAPSLLAYDINLENNKLEIDYWLLEGPTKRSVDLKYEVNSYKKYSIGDNSWKTEIWVNDSIVYYLSDDNRGVGMYAVFTKPAH